MIIDKTLSLILGKAQDAPVTFVAYFAAASALVYLLLTEIQRAQVRIPGFKGPSGLPMIGNIHQIRVNAAEQYRQWAKKFGPVYQIMLGNVPVIVVNSAKSAREIFGANSQALASRPEFYTFHKVVSSTSGTTIGTSPFTESLKRRRKGAASALNKPSVATYIPHIDVETRDFLNEFLTYGDGGRKPVDPMPMIQRLSLSLALTLNWGTRMASQNDELFGEITHVEEEVSKFRSTTGNLQDYIPLLRLNPFNFGSAKAREMRHRRDVYLKKLNDDLDDRMAKGTHQPCIQANVIQDKETKLNHEELVSISLTMLSGGLDTLTTLVAWSMALLAERPEIQRKALEEIRAVYPGDDQILCDANDDQGIPYIVALVRELLRYYTVLRLALPRATVKDIVYNGHTIPSGSVVFLNAWACNMDADVWSDPEVFRPERWLEQPDAPMFTYGLGYRMCAGSLLANREMYTIYLRLLSAFEITDLKAVDGGEMNTHPVDGVIDPTQLVSVPKRYTVRVVPRDEAGLKKALSEYEDHQH
ncbi:uncharacterized protein PV06_09111 [Exophiala oligosperma]|uniref:3-hydroxyphenylacetate 6-hydroxylase n=2 Tax=Chaetothyriales TaxID=34395 RepID=A0A0D2D867_9EURO|nr:uncharacterized protein PV06_09111 [Exophiala oligosperma]KAJ9643706.1 hypothetical protein H2204_001851 [Knufia peltigerae]KIW39333.1 hypothetical protein PV06_09111 [Exophiala oligosperma]